MLFPSNDDVIKWVLEGIDKKAENMFVIRDNLNNVHYPAWVMRGECVEIKRYSIEVHEVVQDAVNLTLAKNYFGQLFRYNKKIENQEKDSLAKVFSVFPVKTES